MPHIAGSSSGDLLPTLVLARNQPEAIVAYGAIDAVRDGVDEPGSRGYSRITKRNRIVSFEGNERKITMRSPFSDPWRRRRVPALLMAAVLLGMATAFLPGGLPDVGLGSEVARAAVAGMLSAAGLLLVSVAFVKTRVHALATVSRSVDSPARRSVNINHDEGFQ